jgi:hypothetical protein
MKLVCLAIVALSLCVSRAGIVSSNLLTVVSVNNSTNTGSAVNLGVVYVPATTFAIQSIGTGGTNFAAGGNIFLGIDTNFAHATLCGSYNATNDTIYGYTLTNGTIPVYAFFQAFNQTNIAVQIGAQAIQQK